MYTTEFYTPNYWISTIRKCYYQICLYLDYDIFSYKFVNIQASNLMGASGHTLLRKQVNISFIKRCIIPTQKNSLDPPLGDKIKHTIQI